MESDVKLGPGRSEIRAILQDCVTETAAVGGAVLLSLEDGGSREPILVGFPNRRAFLERLGTANLAAARENLALWTAEGGAPPDIQVATVEGRQDRLGTMVLFTRRGSGFKEWDGMALRMGARLLGRHLDLQRAANRLQRHYFNTIMALLNTIEAKDHFSRGHSTRVAAYCMKAGAAVGLGRRHLDALNRAALLHDIGKVGIVDTILTKSERLSDEEMSVVRMHPIIGQQIVHDLSFMRKASAYIRAHHERHDGKGYPDGLKGDAIPVPARILAMAETFDTITSDTPYRPGRPLEEASIELRSEKGRQFDPDLVDLFLEAVLLT